MANKETIAKFEELGKKKEAIQKEIDALYDKRADINNQIRDIELKLEVDSLNEKFKKLNLKVGDKLIKTYCKNLKGVEINIVKIIEILDIKVIKDYVKIKVYNIEKMDSQITGRIDFYSDIYYNEIGIKEIIDFVRNSSEDDDISNLIEPSSKGKKITEEEFKKYEYYILNPEEYFKWRNMEDNKLVKLIEDMVKKEREVSKESGGYWNYLNNLSKEELKENISVYIILDSYCLENIEENTKAIKELDSNIYNKIEVYCSKNIAEKSYILGYDDNRKHVDSLEVYKKIIADVRESKND